MFLFQAIWNVCRIDILVKIRYLLLPQVAKEFGFNSNGFSVYLNRNKTGELVSQNKTLSLLKIK